MASDKAVGIRNTKMIYTENYPETNDHDLLLFYMKNEVHVQACNLRAEGRGCEGSIDAQ